MDIERHLESRRDQLLRSSLMSDDFLEFIRKNREPYDALMAYYRCAIMEVETKFRVLNEEFSIEYDRNPIEGIKSRIKSPESLLRKMRLRNVPLNIDAITENIWDIAGLRVVCSFIEDIYLLADCLLQQDDVVLVMEKDYIKDPKPSGYRSLHLIVEVPIFLRNEKRNMKVEVQLRTLAMDTWASLEHKLQYKKDVPAALEAVLEREMIECAELSASLDRRMQQIRNRIAEASPEDSAGRRRLVHHTRLFSPSNKDE